MVYRPDRQGIGGGEATMTHDELREAINQIGRDRRAFASRMVAKVERGIATEDDWEQARYYQRQSRIFEQLKDNRLTG